MTLGQCLSGEAVSDFFRSQLRIFYVERSHGAKEEIKDNSSVAGNAQHFGNGNFREHQWQNKTRVEKEETTVCTVTLMANRMVFHPFHSFV